MTDVPFASPYEARGRDGAQGVGAPRNAAALAHAAYRGARGASAVAIGIATYRRLDGLQRLLDALGRLKFVKQPRPELHVIVVDNDPTGSARAVVGSRRGAPAAALGATLVYAIEPRPGLSYARNRILDLVPPRATVLAFIDDDEVPAPTWLDELLDLWRRTGAAAIAGRVEPHFGAPVPEWVHHGPFFRSPPQRTGEPTRRAGAGNCLIDARVFRDLRLRFDEAYAETGGEDNHYFWRLAATERRPGQRMTVLWCDEAVVTEWIPPERATVRWLLRREYREGGTVALVERDLDGAARTRMTRALRGAGRIGEGILRAAIAPPVGPKLTARAVQGLKLIARGAGMIAGALGVRYREYRR